MNRWVIATIAIVGIGIGTTAWRLARTAPRAEAEGPKKASDETGPPLPSVAVLLGSPEDAVRKSAKSGGARRPVPPAPTVPPSVSQKSPDVSPSLPQPRSEKAAAEKSKPTSLAGKLRREGTRLRGAKGTIRQKGARFEFVPDDGSQPLAILENLLLERFEALAGEPNASKRWIVDGIVTEYRGGNRLLLERLTAERKQ
jgi:hypothetical protein